MWQQIGTPSRPFVLISQAAYLLRKDSDMVLHWLGDSRLWPILLLTTRYLCANSWRVLGLTVPSSVV